MNNNTSPPTTTPWQTWFDADWQKLYPWYGPCDGLACDGGCTECANIRFIPGWTEYKARVFGSVA